jgi:hypothetical protein
MKTQAGIWIDTKRAVIVSINNKKAETKLIESTVETQQGRFDGIRSTAPFESLLVPADDSRERDLEGHLPVYFDEVISAIRDVDCVFIFGPGEIKGMLVKRMEKNKIHGAVVGVETADWMTDPQIEAKVRDYFKDAQ